MDQLEKELNAAIPDVNDEPKVKAFLASDELDPELLSHVVLKTGLPVYLAEFAQQSKANEQLIEHLLHRPGLMMQMIVADVTNAYAKRGRGRAVDMPVQFGPAMKIYADIRRHELAAGKGRQAIHPSAGRAQG